MPHHDGVHALTAGVGLLPCPLTISVLGFAWTQGSAVMVGLVLALPRSRHLGNDRHRRRAGDCGP